MLNHYIRTRLNQWLLGTLLAVLLFFVFAQQHAIAHAISHLSEEINHTLKHDKTSQDNLCEECLCLDNIPDTLLPGRLLLLHAPDLVTSAQTSHTVLHTTPSYRRYAARAPPLFV